MAFLPALIVHVWLLSQAEKRARTETEAELSEARADLVNATAAQERATSMAKAFEKQVAAAKQLFRKETKRSAALQSQLTQSARPGSTGHEAEASPASVAAKPSVNVEDGSTAGAMRGSDAGSSAHQASHVELLISVRNLRQQLDDTRERLEFAHGDLRASETDVERLRSMLSILNQSLVQKDDEIEHLRECMRQAHTEFSEAMLHLETLQMDDETATQAIAMERQHKEQQLHELYDDVKYMQDQLYDLEQEQRARLATVEALLRTCAVQRDYVGTMKVCARAVFGKVALRARKARPVASSTYKLSMSSTW